MEEFSVHRTMNIDKDRNDVRVDQDPNKVFYVNLFL